MTKDSVNRWLHITRWRIRYALLDTPIGKYASLGLAFVFAAFGIWQISVTMRASAAGEPQQAIWVQIVVAIVAALISYALIPKQPDAVDQVTEAPRLEDGAGVRMVFGEVWITDPAIIGWRKMGTKTIRGKKSGFNGRPIIGYWYRQLFHFVLCRGPVDAVLEFRGGDKTAWQGEITASGELQISQRDLWGGQGTGGEGGIEGPLEFLFGDAAQMPSSYLAGALGTQQPAYRGLLSALYKGGLWGAFSPYPKAASFKVRRILEGWERESGAWYSETAEIPIGGPIIRGPVSGTWPWAVRSVDYFVVGAAQEVAGVHSDNQGWWHGYIDSFRITKGVARTAQVSYPVPVGPFETPATDPYYGQVVVLLRMEGEDGSTDFVDEKGHVVESMGGVAISTTRSKWGGSSAYFDGVDGWLKIAMEGDVNLGSGPWTMEAWVWLETPDSRPGNYARAIFGYGPTDTESNDTAWGCRGAGWYFTQLETGSIDAPAVVQNVPPFMTVGRWAFVSICYDGSAYWLHQDGQLLTKRSHTAQVAMNPAHLLYQSITDSWMGAEPEAAIYEPSFREAADTLFAEGFGLCTEWDSTTESLDSFQQRICNVIGANLSRSPVDGLWYLDLIRGGYATSDLPVLTDDDIIEYIEQPGTMQDSVNQVIVEWRDPLRREDRSTSPVQSLGGIQAVGAVVGEVATLREIPEESLALRVGASILQSKSRPLRRINLKVTRIAYPWRPGQVIELRSSRRGIAGMYCRIGDADRGTLRSGAISLTVLQDVFGLPQSVYVTPDPEIDFGDEDVPKPVDASFLQEVPYALLAELHPPGELAALPADIGFLFTVATPAGREVDYSLEVDSGNGYVEQAESDWAATATSVFSVGTTEATVVITAARGLDDMAVGRMVLWGSEVCRLDSVDLILGTLTLGRGCADTVASRHAAGERIWVIDDSVALDATRYGAGATISAKLLPRTSVQRLQLGAAPASEITFSSRAARPYPPAGVTLNGVASPLEVFATAVVEWKHRDRIAYGGRLVDQDGSSEGPETGVTYNVRWFLGGVLDHAAIAVTGNTASHTPVTDGVLRVEIESVRDGLASWQMQVIECNYRVSDYREYVDQVDDFYADQNGNTYNG